MIFDFMSKNSKLFAIEKMAKEFNVSCSGYYKYINKKESPRERKNKELMNKIQLIYKNSRNTYGSPRIHAILKKQGIHCSRKKVAKLMKMNQIQAKTRKKWKAHAHGSKDISKISPNLLNQNFTVKEINKVWVVDITYVFTNEGWLYVSTVLDLYSRKIVGLSMGNRIDTELVIRSLHQAIIHRQPTSGLIVHSDRGAQYTSFDFREMVRKNGFIQSMSARGNCYDNAAMEAFFHTLKTEHVFFCKYKTRKEAMQSIFEYVEVFYNRQRVHSTIGFMSPVEFEKMAVGG